MYRFTLFIAFLSFLARGSMAKAYSPVSFQNSGSAYDLINAVNSLRGSYGVPAYSINAILMFTAQNQAEFMAVNQTVTHLGPGGVSVTDRLLAAGYPLAGDLSLGGFRSENIISGSESMSAENAVQQWTGDDPHLNTMISASLTEIGAGVAINNGRVYYVIDAARPTTSGALTTLPGGESVPQVFEAPIPTIGLNLPNSDGDIFHEVLPGQTLWQIAIAYEVKINDIKALNNLSGDDIYPGQQLLIKRTIQNATNTPPVELEVAVTPSVNYQLDPTSAPQHISTVPSTLPEPVENTDNASIIGGVIGILVLAIMAGIMFSRKSTDIESN